MFYFVSFSQQLDANEEERDLVSDVELPGQVVAALKDVVWAVQLEAAKLWHLF